MGQPGVHLHAAYLFSLTSDYRFPIPIPQTEKIKWIHGNYCPLFANELHNKRVLQSVCFPIFSLFFLGASPFCTWELQTFSFNIMWSGRIICSHLRPLEAPTRRPRVSQPWSYNVNATDSRLNRKSGQLHIQTDKLINKRTKEPTRKTQLL